MNVLDMQLNKVHQSNKTFSKFINYILQCKKYKFIAEKIQYYTPCLKIFYKENVFYIKIFYVEKLTPQRFIN